MSEALLAAAREVRERAYAPYSRFAVGAAARAADGSVHRGVNVESAALPAGVCAERAAVAAAVTAGHRRLVAVAVVGPGRAPCPPCGVCRQLLVEFGLDLTVVAAGEEGPAQQWSLAELLPEAFGGERLPS